MKVTLRQLRKLNDLTQEEMAQELDISLSTWVNWEKRNTYPDAPAINKIIRSFDISYDDIIFFDVNHGLTVKDKASDENE